MLTKRSTLRAAVATLVALAAAMITVPSVAAAETDLDVVVRATSAATAAAAVHDAGGEVRADLELVDGVAATVPAASVARLRAAGHEVAPDAAVTVQGTPAPGSTGMATMKAIGADRLWAAGHTGAGTTVAVIDTGIEALPDFAGRLVGGVDFSGGDDPFDDEFGHGTFIAGLIAGSGASHTAYRGVAPKANLVSVKIAGASGASDISHVLAALQWVVSHRDRYGIDVVNLSLGTDSPQSYRLSLLNYAVERAWDAGIVVVVSASNSGPQSRTITKPADDPLVITVGALDTADTVTMSDDKVAEFSGRGPTRADGLTKPDLIAPGTSVVSLRVPGSTIDTDHPEARIGTAHFRGSGTSFSTAVTSGSVAVLLADEPALSPDQVKFRLGATTLRTSTMDPNVHGRGVLQAQRAVDGTTTQSANRNVVRSTGTGEYDLDRGSLAVQIETGVERVPILGGLLGLVTWLLRPILTLLDGLLTAQNETFDQHEYLTSTWDGTSWYDSQWAGRTWHGTSWYGTSWYGTSWYGTSWYGTSWHSAG